VAKTSAATSVGDSIHTRTTADAVESQAVVVAIDGSDSVVPADTLNGLDVDVTRVQGTVTVGGTVAVSSAPTTAVTGPLTDTQLRASAVPVSGTFFQATQPVSMATNTPDVTDRAARLLGHVTVDTAPTTAVTQSGTWTVQPGNTANTTAWKVDGSAVTQPVSGTVTANGQATATSAVTNVAASATSVTLKASNASRKGLYIFNAGTSNLFVKLGATATTTTSFTVMIAPNGFWELPDTPIYTGVVDGILSATGGSGALVTELT
jgi:hypothetical protein